MRIPNPSPPSKKVIFIKEHSKAFPLENLGEKNNLVHKLIIPNLADLVKCPK